jgi:TetR/AcrR family transcriptional regulator, mexJK operon transcriptional repressor
MAATVETSPPIQEEPTIGADGARRAPPSKAGRGGRPTRVDALRLGDRILEVATELFLTEGYGSTSIEKVATRAGISKRTFYHRFDGKAELFAAVVHLIEGTTLEEILTRLARFILQAALSPPALALHRLITAESARFPELARAVSGEGSTQEAIALISGLVARERPDPPLSPQALAATAQIFLDLVITEPQRRALGLGTPMTATELDVWAHRVVQFFMRGCIGADRSGRDPLS